MKRRLFRVARRLAQTKGGQLMVGWSLAHLHFALPLDRLHETESLLAFHHPQPSYALHIVLMPKQAIAHLGALDTAHTAFMQDLFATVQLLVTRFKLETSGYRLICNGGAYQDIPHLHFHLVADSAPFKPNG